MSIETLLQKKNEDSIKPEIFDLSVDVDRAAVEELLKTEKIQQISDSYEVQLEEYFQVLNPSKVYAPEFKALFAEYLAGVKAKAPLWQQGRWIYYPWRALIVHILEEKEFFEVRTARNKNLINQEEQEKYYNSTIGIAGLSVGNSVVLANVLQGGGRHWKIADHDTLELSNTNRIRTGIDGLGVKKTTVTARQMYEVNPYLEIEIFDGVTPENIDQFFNGLSVVIDEIDNLAVKYLIREHARKNKIAVVMAADNGDNGVLDIERYDLDQTTQFFHGRMGDVSYEMLAGLDKFGIGKMITKHVGPENVTERMQNSLLEMGKTVVSWPQLGGAALLNGPAVAYAVRKILNGQPLENNRALISLDALLEPGYNTPESETRRKAVADGFRKIFGL
ncbi:MAG: ThiF family adenylyltransferase [Patescibacteria group bacterium]